MRAIDLEDEEMPVEEKVYHLRLGGMSIPEIAGRLGLKKTAVATLYRDYLTELAKLAELEGTEQALLLEKTRLDRLHEVYWHSATEDHEKMVLVGKGADAYYEKMTVDPDIDAAKFVLEISKQRSKLEGFDQLSPVDSATVNTVLVVGNDTATFLAALQEGRRQQLTSAHQDNEVVEGTVEAELEGV